MLIGVAGWSARARARSRARSRRASGCSTRWRAWTSTTPGSSDSTPAAWRRCATTALNLQLHFLATRFESMRRIRGAGGSWVLDRTWYEDAEIFARGHFDEGLMSELEWGLYRMLYAELLHSPAARPPRLLVYLHAPLETIVERIRARGRPKERDTPDVVLGRVARALRAVDRPLPGLSRAEPRRARVRPRRAIPGRSRRSRRASARGWSPSCRRRSCSRERSWNRRCEAPRAHRHPAHASGVIRISLDQLIHDPAARRLLPALSLLALFAACRDRSGADASATADSSFARDIAMAQRQVAPQTVFNDAPIGGTPTPRPHRKRRHRSPSRLAYARRARRRGATEPPAPVTRTPRAHAARAGGDGAGPTPAAKPASAAGVDRRRKQGRHDDQRSRVHALRARRATSSPRRSRTPPSARTARPSAPARPSCSRCRRWSAPIRRRTAASTSTCARSTSTASRIPPMARSRPSSTMETSRVSSGNDKTKVVGGAIAGAVLGRILGGGTKGTVIGAAAGAAAGTAAAKATQKTDACLPEGAPSSSPSRATSSCGAPGDLDRRRSRVTWITRRFGRSRGDSNVNVSGNRPRLLP